MLLSMLWLLRRFLRLFTRVVVLASSILPEKLD